MASFARAPIGAGPGVQGANNVPYPANVGPGMGIDSNASSGDPISWWGVGADRWMERDESVRTADQYVKQHLPLIAETSITVMVLSAKNLKMLNRCFPTRRIDDKTQHMVFTRHEVNAMMAVRSADLAPWTIGSTRSSTQRVTMADFVLGYEASIRWKEESTEGMQLFQAQLRACADGFQRTLNAMAWSELVRMSANERDLVNLGVHGGNPASVGNTIRNAYGLVGVCGTDAIRGAARVLYAMNETLTARGVDKQVATLMMGRKVNVYANYADGTGVAANSTEAVANQAHAGTRLSSLGVDVMIIDPVNNGPGRNAFDPVRTRLTLGNHVILNCMSEVNTIYAKTGANFRTSMLGRKVFNFDNDGRWVDISLEEALAKSGLFGYAPVDGTRIVNEYAEFIGGRGDHRTTTVVDYMRAEQASAEIIRLYTEAGGADVVAIGRKQIGALTWGDMKVLFAANVPPPFTAIFFRTDLTVDMSAAIGVAPGPVGMSLVGQTRVRAQQTVYGLDLGRISIRMAVVPLELNSVVIVPGPTPEQYVCGGNTSIRTPAQTQAQRERGSAIYRDTTAPAAMVAPISLAEADRVMAETYLSVCGTHPMMGQTRPIPPMFSTAHLFAAAHGYRVSASSKTAAEVLGIGIAARAFANAQRPSGFGVNMISCVGASCARCDDGREPEQDAAWGVQYSGWTHTVFRAGGVRGRASAPHAQTAW